MHVDLGQILTVGGIVVSIVIAHVKTAERIQAIETKVGMLYEDWSRKR